MVMGPRLGSFMSVSNSAGEQLVFVFTGESNSGGMGLNSSASGAELAARSNLKILNNTSLAFESLNIGAHNNLIDHSGLDSTLYHGWELGLANQIDAGAFPGRRPVYLIKTGQGGSTIAQWAVGQTYWTKFLERINAAKAVLKPQRRWVVWFSLGLNDIVAGTNVTTWKADVLAHLAKIRVELPGCQFVMTEFQGMTNDSSAYDTAIQEIAAGAADVASISASGSATDGGNHWSYAGFKDTIVPRMITATLAQLT